MFVCIKWNVWFQTQNMTWQFESKCLPNGSFDLTDSPRCPIICRGEPPKPPKETNLFEDEKQDNQTLYTCLGGWEFSKTAIISDAEKDSKHLWGIYNETTLRVGCNQDGIYTMINPTDWPKCEPRKFEVGSDNLQYATRSSEPQFEINQKTRTRRSVVTKSEDKMRTTSYVYVETKFTVKHNSTEEAETPAAEVFRNEIFPNISSELPDMLGQFRPTFIFNRKVDLCCSQPTTTFEVDCTSCLSESYQCAQITKVIPYCYI